MGVFRDQPFVHSREAVLSSEVKDATFGALLCALYPSIGVSIATVCQQGV